MSKHPDRKAVLLNPAAGRGRAGRSRGRVEEAFQRRGIAYDLFITESEEHLRQLTREKAREYPTVVGVGGDSTLQIMAEEMIKGRAGAALGMIGLGSSNDITREFGLADIEKGSEAIKRGNRRRIDLGEISSEGAVLKYFIGQANIGLGVWVNRYVEELTGGKPHWGKFQILAGIAGAISAYRKKMVPIPLRVETDSRRITGSFLIAAFTNISYWANGMKLHPDAHPDDGRLEACLIRPCSFCRLASLAVLAKRGRLQGAEEVERLPAPAFDISSDQAFSIQTDGEVIGGRQSPAHFRRIQVRVVPQALTIIA
jgi:diacylglycerol kinase (ATP)